MSLPTHILSDNDRFHCFKDDYADRSINNAISRGELYPDDAVLIRSYISEKTITSAIGSKRILKIASNLVTVRRFLGPFREATIPDIYAAVTKINSGNSIKDKPFSQNTRVDLIQVLKSFYLWLIENEEISLSEKKIRKIKLPQKIPTKTANDLLSPDEIQAMIQACSTSRDRAIISILYEGGFRVGEIGEMKWGDLKIDGTGIIVNVIFKTGKPRYIRLVMAKEHMIKWKSDYPGEIKDDGFVFLTEKHTPLTHGGVMRQLERIAKRAGITKHINPHLFRHTRITHLIQQGVNESIIKLMMWGSINSKMFLNYAHLTGTDIDKEMFRLYGIEPGTQTTDDKLEPKICPHCKEINSPISHFCHVCGQALDDAGIKNDKELSEFLFENAEDLIEFLNQYRSQTKQ